MPDQPPGNAAKGSNLRRVDAISNSERRQEFLAALRNWEQEPDYVQILVKYAETTDGAGSEAEYLRAKWYNSGGFWPTSQYPKIQHPLEPIVRQSLIKALELATRDPDTGQERHLPIDTYWVCAGDEFKVIIACSAQQVTRIVLTPPTDAPVMVGRLDKRGPIWIVQHGDRSAKSGMERDGEFVEEMVEQGKVHIVTTRPQTPLSIDLRKGPIDPKDRQFQRMLQHLQGNILKGHGRDYAVHIFLQFKSDPPGSNIPNIKRWIRDFANRYVTSARQQLREADEFKAHRVSGSLFGNLFLSAKGYESLGFTDLATRFQEEGAFIKFRDGMQAGQPQLNDPNPAEWEEAYRERKIDAMILLADDDEDFLLRRVREVITDLQAIADVLTVEPGRVLRNNNGDGIEHFGYVDGISQPLFLREALSPAQASGAPPAWDPAAPLSLALLPDPYAEEDDCCGSYLVFRKLEQNVRGFIAHERALGQALGDAQRAEALIVGRFRDGTPITLSDRAGMNHPTTNDFSYDDDGDGTKCPFHAHIRKTNPRDETRRFGATLAGERAHRIVRRGMPYGERKVEPKDNPSLDQLPTGGVGLLFTCFQRSLAEQFGHLQKIWANSPSLAIRETGLDPVIGQKGSGGDSEGQRWPLAWGKPEKTPFHFGDFITLKGGEFFFAPSIPFLKSLSSDRA